MADHDDEDQEHDKVAAEVHDAIATVLHRTKLHTEHEVRTRRGWVGRLRDFSQPLWREPRRSWPHIGH